MGNAATNICVQVSVWTSVSNFLAYMPSSEIAGSHGNSNYFRNCQTVFFHGCSTSVPYSGTVYESSNFSTSSSILVILLVKSIHIILVVSHVVLICISLITNDVEHLSMCLLATHISSLEKCQFKSFTHFLKILLFFFVGLFLSFYYIWAFPHYYMKEHLKSFKDFIYLFLERREGRERGRETSMWERHFDLLPLANPQTGTWPTTQECPLTGNRTSDPWACRLMLNPLTHTSQGSPLFIF